MRPDHKAGYFLGGGGGGYVSWGGGVGWLAMGFPGENRLHAGIAPRKLGLASKIQAAIKPMVTVPREDHMTTARK